MTSSPKIPPFPKSPKDIEVKVSSIWKGDIPEFYATFNISLIEPPEFLSDTGVIESMLYVEVTTYDSETSCFEILYDKKVLKDLIASGEIIQEVKNAYLNAEMYHKQDNYDGLIQ